jgi:glyoxylase-like metal-dependent hydrolase (beta-lactamase superfamily II)
MPLTFNRDFEPRTGEAIEVAPSVRRVTAPNAGPFTFHGTNTFLIGAKTLAVLDPGPADPAHIDALMLAIGGAEVAHILVSHTHRDHSPGARLLQARTGGKILAEGRHRPSRPPRTGEELRLDTGGDLEFMPDAILKDGEIVERDGYRLQAIATPGHTANHLAFALAGTDILFSGDHVMGWSTTVVAPPDGSMTDYMASLDRLLDRQERRYLPAHGGAVENAPAYMRALRAHRKMREAAILDGLRRGDRKIPDLVARVYQGLDPRLSGAAALSTLAHLEELVERGAVSSDGAPALDSTYWVAAAGSG